MEVSNQEPTLTGPLVRRLTSSYYRNGGQRLGVKVFLMHLKSSCHPLNELSEKSDWQKVRLSYS